IGMKNGLAVRSELKSCLEQLIEQQEKEFQAYKIMGFGAAVPQEDAIVEQINLYKQTLEQVKNAPTVAFMPETLSVARETKKDWQTGEVQRYNTMEINTKTGEITFVQDKNNPNPNPFGEMSEQARQYLSANNNFALAALGVAPKTMPENVKYDLIGQPKKENTMNRTVFEFNNGYAVLMHKELENDLATRTDFVGEAALYHKDSDTLLAEFNCYSDDDEGDFYGEIVLFDKEKGYTNPDECIDYYVDIANPNWKEDLAKAMVDFGVAREHITKLNANKEFGQPEIVAVRHGDNVPVFPNLEQQRIEQQRIEKREEIFDMLWAARSMDNIYFDNTPPNSNEIWAKYGNMIGRFDEKTGDLSFRDYNGGGAVFIINTDKISARTAAVAFMRGIDEYVKQYKYGVMQVDLTPKRRRDIQDRVNFVISENRRMDDPTNFPQRREFVAKRQERFAQKEVSGNLKEQTAENGGFFSPENRVKFDDFGVSEKSYGQVLNEYSHLKSNMSKVDTDIQHTYNR
ncbi:MAG: hypothetical protein IKX14_03325, partial [Neisseriaceae bacterium]|nr:hypothetical protein [Neisseriaceae bacterium]